MAEPPRARHPDALAVCALCMMLGAAGTAVAASVRCHIHPPDGQAEDGASGARIIGPFDGRDRCEAERWRLFGDLGRCHCTAGFTPDWLRDAPDAGRQPPALQPAAPLP